MDGSYKILFCLVSCYIVHRLLYIGCTKPSLTLYFRPYIAIYGIAVGGGMSVFMLVAIICCGRPGNRTNTGDQESIRT